MSNTRKRNYKPSPGDLSKATRELWTYVDDARVLAELRDSNGVTMAPGEFSQREILAYLYDVVDAWHEGNYGNSGARKFLANLVRRGLMSVQPSTTPGRPSKYTIATDPETGEPYDEDTFCTLAYEYRKAAYRPTASKPASEPQPAKVDSDAFADIMKEL